MASVSTPQPVKAAILAPRPIPLFLDARKTMKSMVDTRNKNVVALNKRELVIIKPPKDEK
jgi:hypothetical protein